tara:strand:+ start:889 stop:1029 length:141 start_codon:yes stop_codon:yes gene_type:complete
MSEYKSPEELAFEAEVYIDGDKTKGIKPEKLTVRNRNLEITTAEEI